MLEAYEEFGKNIENRPAALVHPFYEDWVNYYIVNGISVPTAGRQGLHECKEMFRLTRIEIVVPRFQCICFKDVRIKIRIHKSAMDRVLDFCTYEDFSSDGDEHYIVNFPFVENEYHYGILLSFGDKCECLEPLHVRAEIKRRIQDIATIYEG